MSNVLPRFSGSHCIFIFTPYIARHAYNCRAMQCYALQCYVQTTCSIILHVLFPFLRINISFLSHYRLNKITDVISADGGDVYARDAVTLQKRRVYVT